MQIKPYYWHRGRVSMIANWQVTFDSILKHVRETEYNVHPLSKNPAVRKKIAEMAIDLKVSRLLIYRLAWMLSKGLDVSDCSTIHKIIGDNVFLRLGNNAMQVLGLAGQLGGEVSFLNLSSGQLGGGASYAPLSGMMEAMYRGVSHSHFAGSGGATTAKNFLAIHGLGLPEF
jgi:alkylation response protein AidB-like acyl-CoA dehydrogenase